MHQGGTDTGWGCPSETSSSLAECAFADGRGEIIPATRNLSLVRVRNNPKPPDFLSRSPGGFSLGPEVFFKEPWPSACMRKHMRVLGAKDGLSAGQPEEGSASSESAACVQTLSLSE